MDYYYILPLDINRISLYSAENEAARTELGIKVSPLSPSVPLKVRQSFATGKAV